MKIHKQQDFNTAYNKAFKFRFYPDSEQIVLLEHYFGSARFVYNQLSRITDGTKKDEPKIKEALLKLESAFPELRRGSIRVNLAVLATML